MIEGRFEEMEPADQLGRAVDLLIERCQTLDRDRTALARALTKVKDELIRQQERNSFLSNRCQLLESTCQTASERLEVLLGSFADEGEPRPKEDEKDILEDRVVKPLDIGSFERIVRDAGGVLEPEPEEEPLEQDLSSQVGDRLF